MTPAVKPRRYNASSQGATTPPSRTSPSQSFLRHYHSTATIISQTSMIMLATKIATCIKPLLKTSSMGLHFLHVQLMWRTTSAEIGHSVRLGRLSLPQRRWHPSDQTPIAAHTWATGPRGSQRDLIRTYRRGHRSVRSLYVVEQGCRV